MASSKVRAAYKRLLSGNSTEQPLRIPATDVNPDNTSFDGSFRVLTACARRSWLTVPAGHLSSRAGLAPYSGSMAKSPPKKPKDPAKPTRAKARAAGRQADAGRARRPAQSGINKGTAGMGSGHRAPAAAGQFLGPPPRFFRRAQGAQVDAEGISTKRRSATMRPRRSPGSIRQLARELGTRRRRRLSSPSPAGGGSSAEARQSEGGRGGVADAKRFTPPAGFQPATSPSRGRWKKASRTELIPNTACRAPTCRQARGGLASMGVAATAQSLEQLLREGRAGILRRDAVDAAPPAAAGEIRRRPETRHRVRLRAEGRPAAGDQGTGRRRASATTARRCCSASPARARPSPWRR